MKILHINSSDISGGAARAAHRIHKSLLVKGVDSWMLVQEKKTNEPKIIVSDDWWAEKKVTRFRPYVNGVIQKLQKTENPILHSANILPSGLHKKINNSDADIVHFHWVNREMISISEISKIEKPIVWTLHDMWAFSGAEHYDDLRNPKRYVEGYTKTNRPKSYFGLDIDRWVWRRKKRYWKDVDFNFVTPSSWLANCLRASNLFEGVEVRVIPNGLDTEIFKPVSKELAREKLNLPRDKKIVLYGAMSAESNPIKGYQKLVEAKEFLAQKSDTDNLLFVVFGSNEVMEKEEFGVTTKYLGYIDNNEKLALLYSAADVMVVPSILEAFGQTVSEAMSCGTPVVAFDATGPREIINHKQNGYLAKSYDSKKLGIGIHWILEDKKTIKRLSENARKKALEKYALDKVAEKYINFYKKVLN